MLKYSHTQIIQLLFIYSFSQGHAIQIKLFSVIGRNYQPNVCTYMGNSDKKTSVRKDIELVENFISFVTAVQKNH